MTYHQLFDRLGNPVYRAKPSWHHRAIRWASGIVGAACIGALMWMRP